EAITSVLSYATRGTGPLVLTTALANAVAEEVFFRGALYAALAERRAVPVSAAVYVTATAATRNPALVLASAVMGTLFAAQRRASGGGQAPILTHVTWSALMLRYLPPRFREPRPAGAGSTGGGSASYCSPAPCACETTPFCGTPYIPTCPSGTDGGHCLGQLSCAPAANAE